MVLYYSSRKLEDQQGKSNGFRQRCVKINIIIMDIIHYPKFIQIHFGDSIHFHLYVQGVRTQSGPQKWAGLNRSSSDELCLDKIQMMDNANNNKLCLLKRECVCKHVLRVQK